MTSPNGYKDAFYETECIICRGRILRLPVTVDEVDCEHCRDTGMEPIPFTELMELR